MEKQKLERIEAYVFEVFRRRGVSRVLTREIFDDTGEYANADLVRAFEDLEKKWRLLVRYTDEGNDWLRLTEEGMRYAGIKDSETADGFTAQPHPPKSST